MKNARRNIALAAVAAATLALAPSALADVRIHLNLPLPPPPHKVLKHLPVPPLPPPPVVVYDDHRDGRWGYQNRDRDDRWMRRHEHHARRGYVWVEGRWVYPPFPGAVWVEGHYDRWGYWVRGYWARPRYR